MVWKKVIVNKMLADRSRQRPGDERDSDDEMEGKAGSVIKEIVNEIQD